MKKVVITGGDGFLGSHLVEALLERDVDIVVCDRFRNGTSRFLDPYRDRVTLIGGDIHQDNGLMDALEGADVMYHLIWSGNPALTWTSPLFEVETNLRSAIAVFEMAAEQGVKKIIFPSSAGALYQPKEGLITETESIRPMTPYGIAKLAAEEFLNYFSVRFPIQSDIYRISSLYGSRQPIGRKQGVVAEWCHSIAESGSIKFFGQGKTVRDYIHVDDAARLMLTSLDNQDASNVYNLGSGKGVSLAELLEIFQNRIGTPFEVMREERRDCDAQAIVLSNEQIMKHHPEFVFKTLEAEIDSIFEYYRSTLIK